MKPTAQQVYRKIHMPKKNGRHRSGQSQEPHEHRLLIDVDVWAASTSAVLNSAPLSPIIHSPDCSICDESFEELNSPAGGGRVGTRLFMEKDRAEQPVGAISTEARVQYCAAWHPTEV